MSVNEINQVALAGWRPLCSLLLLLWITCILSFLLLSSLLLDALFRTFCNGGCGTLWFFRLAARLEISTHRVSEARVFGLPLDSSAVEKFVLRFWLDDIVDYAHEMEPRRFVLLKALLLFCFFDFAFDARLRLAGRILMSLSFVFLRLIRIFQYGILMEENEMVFHIVHVLARDSIDCKVIPILGNLISCLWIFLS